jgi:hypothetical protein
MSMSGGAKRQSTPSYESGSSTASTKEPVIHARGEESADELVSRERASSAPAMPAAPEKKSGNVNNNGGNSSKEKESDAWDIPAFLRRRKR